MNKEEISKVVMELIGGVYPIGDSNYDEKALENLEKMIFVADDLICEIQEISRGKESLLGSVATSGRKADKYIEQLIRELKEADNE